MYTIFNAGFSYGAKPIYDTSIIVLSTIMRTILYNIQLYGHSMVIIHKPKLTKDHGRVGGKIHK